MQTRHLLHLVFALLVAAGCSPDSEPAGPQIPAAPPDLAAHAFQLTINVATGRVSVASPTAESQAARTAVGGPSFSLLGNDVIRLHASDCTFSSLPRNRKQKRCTMQLAIENRLELADLVTPTSFPRPPQGGGLLVFPFTAAALGVPGGAAVPNGLWDQPPTNFFNDFGGCTGGGTRDCYRWERYPSPLAAGETSVERTVGFDVSTSAQSVAVYLVVAADVRDAAPKSLNLAPVAAGCGTVGGSGGGSFATPGPINPRDTEASAASGVCTFELPDLLRDKAIVSATLTLQQVSMADEFASANGYVVARSVTFDIPMTDAVSLTVLNDSLGTLSDSPEPGPRSVDVLAAVVGDLAAGRGVTQYRFAPEPSSAYGETSFAGVTGGPDDPKLTVTYRER